MLEGFGLESIDDYVVGGFDFSNPFNGMLSNVPTSFSYADCFENYCESYVLQVTKRNFENSSATFATYYV